MDPTLTSTDAVKEQRLLAAIVFTDVVGFSKLASKNEARVYVSLQRDMGVMTDLCRSHGGQVLNTMGDGMLMVFPSAVDAMAAAVEIQRTLAAQAQSLPPTDVLHHRIGVHLGDIIMKGDNVFGDGVNTAARLQNDARPDSVWYSQTVNEVIKNKLKIDSRYIGKRQFKNLGEPVQVWEVPPLVEVRARVEADAIGAAVPASNPEPQGISGGRGVLLVLVSLLMVGSIVFAVTRMKPPPEEPRVTKPKPDKPPQFDDPVVQGTTGTVPATTSGTQQTPTITIAQVHQRIDELKRTYSFVQIVEFLNGEASSLAEARPLIDRFTQMAQLRAWMEQALQASTAADPVTAELSQGKADLYNVPPVNIRLNGAGWEGFDITNLAPSDFLGLARALQMRPASQAPGEAEQWMSLFAAEYKLA
ncbi:MAG TPA: adenylate/guanylate cyclase domain-containing protein [Fimbriimonas sp.]|nr:adenylate/guanylate cyclase domain-containing protein [Fimbriimonas sp.]